MAHLHTALPREWKGEQLLASQLAALPDPGLHLWCAIDYLPLPNEIDLLIWHEAHGAFVVEVKGVFLESVLEFGPNVCVIEGRPRDDGPHNQAHRAMKGLRDYLGTRMRPPFLVSTACWPRISREAWIRRWPDARVKALAASMIFAEDIAAGPEVFARRLAAIWNCPPTPARPKYAFRHTDDGLRAFKHELGFSALPQPTPTDLERLEAIERSVNTSTDREVPPDGTHHVFYSGHPGTGKTFRLLRIGHQHALAGRHVLFACFNKVLATDQRRLMGFSEPLRLASGTLQIYDAFALVGEHAELHGIPYADREPDEWAQRVVEHMRRNPPARRFDTLLIDESQDMRGWMFDMLALHARPDATVCVAYGSGQGLYGEPAEWVTRFRAEHGTRQLNRNFRNTKPVFMLAQTCYEARFAAGRIDPVLARFRSRRRDAQTELEFARPEGLPTLLTYVDDSALAELSPSALPRRQHDLMVTAYRRIILDRLRVLRESERPMDLLLLVPGEKSLEREWTVDALAGIEGVERIDYTVEANRRHPSRPETVRVCTFHSSRGIEGTRVIVFGLHHLDRMGDPPGSDAPNLGYIALSRATFECEIVVRSSQAAAPILAFVEQTVRGILAVQAGEVGAAAT